MTQGSCVKSAHLRVAYCATSVVGAPLPSCWRLALNRVLSQKALRLRRSSSISTKQSGNVKKKTTRREVRRGVAAEIPRSRSLSRRVVFFFFALRALAFCEVRYWRRYSSVRLQCALSAVLRRRVDVASRAWANN